MKLTTTLIKNHSKGIVSTIALAMTTVALGGAAHAQTATPNFFLTSSNTTAGPNATVTVFLSLKDGADDTSGLGSTLTSFDTNISFSNSSLSFVSLFTKDAASPFSDQLTDTETASSLRAAFDVPFSNPMVDATGKTILLGSFQVQVAGGGLPAAGTSIMLGSQSISVNAGGSELINGNTFSNVLQSVTPVKLTAAPEPSVLVALAFGMSSVGLMVWRKRRAA